MMYNSKFSKGIHAVKLESRRRLVRRPLNNIEKSMKVWWRSVYDTKTHKGLTTFCLERKKLPRGIQHFLPVEGKKALKALYLLYCNAPRYMIERELPVTEGTVTFRDGRNTLHQLRAQVL